MISKSYEVIKVHEGNKLWILCSDTIAIRMSNVDVNIETLGNIGRVLNKYDKIND